MKYHRHCYWCGTKIIPNKDLSERGVEVHNENEQLMLVHDTCHKQIHEAKMR